MSERIDTNQVARNAAAERIESDDYRYSCELEVPARKTVRERSEAPGTHRDYQDRPKYPAHPSNRLVAQLNASWRVADDPLQWILQRRKGHPRKKNGGWRARSFCRTREALLRCIREYCGEIDPLALTKLKSLPDWHLDWHRRDDRTNLDVRRTDQAQADGQSKPLVSKGLDDCETADQAALTRQSALT
jgi:hypothetical protein